MKQKSNHSIFYIISLIIIMVLLVCVFGGIRGATTSMQVTRQAALTLTNNYGPEVWAVIENFMVHWGSTEIEEDPDLPRELATEPFWPSDNWWELETGSSWDIQMGTEISGIYILEYTSDYFRTLICVPPETNSYQPFYQAVFEKHEGIWKLAAIYNV